MKTITLTVDGMSCSHCVNAIESALKEMGAAGNVNLEDKTVRVDLNEEKTSVEQVREAIEDLGYEVR